MGLTTEFKETVKARAERDPEFRKALLAEALTALVAGELGVAKSLLRDYINATDGFNVVGAEVGKDRKSLMRMLSSDGNPQARNLLDITSHLQQRAGWQFKVVCEEPASATPKRSRKKSVR